MFCIQAHFLFISGSFIHSYLFSAGVGGMVVLMTGGFVLPSIRLRLAVWKVRVA
jgi:hypothetical protein